MRDLYAFACTFFALCCTIRIMLC
uniref:Uncharacterized protein n=1 Tax=Rhizophora mucronata TaxID=61149 RepID=A0A2P2NU75_RHIMU